MADRPPRPGRWWRRLPRPLELVGGGIGNQLRGRLLPGGRVGEELYEVLFEMLVGSDCGAEIADQLVGGVRARAAKQRVADANQLLAALRAEMEARLDGPDRELHLSGQPAVWLISGVNGAGKTTTVAKLAARMSGQGLQPLIAAADTFRSAAIDQLKVMAARSGTEVVAHQIGADPASVVFDALAAAKARGREIVLVDTAGRLHTKQNLMMELAKIRRVIAAQLPEQPVESLLVLDAYVGANAIAQARNFSEAIGATGLVLTKLDGSARAGFVFQVEQELGIPVKLIGLGEGVEDLADFEPAVYVDAFLQDPGPVAN